MINGSLFLLLFADTCNWNEPANKSCHRKLDSGNLTTHDNELYCKICYARLFGPKGYGHGLGAGVLSMDTASDQGSSSGSEDRPTDSPPAVQPQTNTVPTRRPVTSPSNGVSKPNFDNFGNRIDICPRCNKQVYMAEKMMGGGKVSRFSQFDGKYLTFDTHKTRAWLFLLFQGSLSSFSLGLA